MRKTCCMLLLLAGLNAGLQAQAAEIPRQRTGVLIGGGLAAFEMGDLRILQEHILSTYPLEGRITSSFPDYSYGQINIVHQLFPSLRVGGGYGITSTGGKSSYVDYSGSIQTYILANSHRIGGFAAYSILGGRRLDLSLYGRIDANFSRIEVNSSLVVGGYSSSSTYNYSSVSPDLTGGLELFYHFRSISVGIEAGYLMNVASPLKNKESGSALYDPDDRSRRLSADWTGYRLGLKFIVWTL